MKLYLKMSDFYPQQIITANKIICGFVHSYRNILLIAQMQCGKSATSLYVAFTMLKNNIVKNIVLFSGVSEITLKTQWELAINRSIKYFEHKFNMKINRKNIHIIWSNDIENHDPIPNSIYLHDESHYAQTNGNRPYKWYEKNNISVNGHDTTLKERNIYWLSISATPCSELSNIKIKNQNKGIIILPVDDTYIGIKTFVENNHFFRTNYEDFGETFENICRNIPEKSYSLIRYRLNNISNTIRQITDRYNIKIMTYNSNDSSDIKDIKELEKEPEMKTMIFVSGKLRCGKSIPKKYVSTIIETSHNPNTDTILQGLIGRCCGYYNPEFKIRIYVSEISLKGILEYKNAIDNNFKIGFGKSKNVPHYIGSELFSKTSGKDLFGNDFTDFNKTENLIEYINFTISQNNTNLDRLKLDKRYYNQENLKTIFDAIKKQNPMVKIKRRIYLGNSTKKELKQLTIYENKKNSIYLREICKTIGEKISGSKKELIKRILKHQKESNYMYIININFEYKTESSTFESNSSVSEPKSVNVNCDKCDQCNEKYCINICRCINCVSKGLKPYMISDLSNIVFQYL